MKRKIIYFVVVTFLTLNLKAQSTDADAQTFLTATGITDATHKSAVNQLVLDLKAAGIWAKMKAVYPFVGGDALKHSYNLKNPAAYQITFNGTWVHSATGSLPDGVSAYADTHLDVGSISGWPYSSHMSFYSSSNITPSASNIFYDMGLGNNTGSELLALNIKRSSTMSSWDANSYPGARLSGNAVVNDTRGLFTGSRTGANQTDMYQNSANILTGTLGLGNSSFTTSKTIFIGSFNEYSYVAPFNQTNIYYGVRECGFASIGDGLTASEVSALSQAVHSFRNNLLNVGTVSSFQWTTVNNNIYNSNVGNVGIGTLNPHELLSVNGNILAKKVKVSIQASDWADYVFDKKYKLLSLHVIEKFIKANHHLPEIQSAQDVEKNGIDLGVNQALLLKKIEELTLIVIRQEKKIEEQSKKLGDIENKINK